MFEFKWKILAGPVASSFVLKNILHDVLYPKFKIS